jgi:hypothetical protein
MGLKCSPDITQTGMEYVSADTKDANVYIDDVGAFFNNLGLPCQFDCQYFTAIM